ncbi:hypothetical protein BC832DRAFT_557278 [Gaertneriomyces semiglobifer]|nr:hypothetical protein BC832DRAFT_557278 [Gaertneriomyces semiglobifer]
MMFKAALRPLAGRPASAASRALVPRRHQSTSVFAADNLKKFLPDVKFTGETTLGEIFEKGYTRYRYRLVYPIAAWVGFLYVYMWHPYRPEAEKKVDKDRLDYLDSLKFRQV